MLPLTMKDTALSVLSMLSIDVRIHVAIDNEGHCFISIEHVEY